MALEEPNKKVVPMHCPQGNCKETVAKIASMRDFWSIIICTLGKLDNGECIAMEEFIEGKFTNGT